MVGSVKVIHGSADGVFDGIVGVTVACLKASLQGAFNIPSNAVAFVNGQRVASAHRLQGGSVLEFCQRRGQKGVNRLLTKAQIRSEYAGVPATFFKDVLPNLRTTEINSDGEALYVESVVDKNVEGSYGGSSLPPDCLSFKGKTYTVAGSLEHRLMVLLIERNSVAFETAIEELYPKEEGFKANAFKQTVKRLSKKLLDQGGPMVCCRKGNVFFE